MNHLACRLASVALLAAALPPLRTQYSSPPRAQPFPGLINEQLRTTDVDRSAWTIGVNVRLRREDSYVYTQLTLNLQPAGGGAGSRGHEWDSCER